MNPAQYCRQKALTPGSSLYYATLFQNADVQEGLCALLAFSRELEESVLDCQDGGVARIKLQWWREEIQRLADGQPRHPVTQHCLDNQVLSTVGADTLLAHINVHELEIAPASPETLSDWINEYAAAHATCWSLATVLTSGHNLPEQAWLLAACIRVVELLQQTRQVLARGYVPYPRQSMQAHQLNENTILEPDNRERHQFLQNQLAKELKEQLNNILRGIEPQQWSAAGFLLTGGGIALANASRMSNLSVQDGTRPMSITPLRKLWIAWRWSRRLSRNS